MFSSPASALRTFSCGGARRGTQTESHTGGRAHRRGLQSTQQWTGQCVQVRKQLRLREGPLEKIRGTMPGRS